MLSFPDVISAARDSWTSNFTAADKKWRLKQLHQLYELVMSNRDTLVATLAAEQSVSIDLYEREIAILVKEIHSHVKSLEVPNSKGRAVERSLGVIVILCNSANFIRHGLVPLAAAITAGNATVLATNRPLETPLMTSLQLSWHKYLGSDAIFLAAGVNNSSINNNDIDHVAIFDSDAEAYSLILQSPKAHFHEVEAGLNLAIFGTGEKNWSLIVDEILSHSRDQRLPSDRITAVFTRQEEVDEFKEALFASLPDLLPPSEQFSAEEDVLKRSQIREIVGISHWATDIFKLGVDSDAQTLTMGGLGGALKEARDLNGLLIVPVSSLDEAIDLVINEVAPIHHLSLLAPSGNKEISYVREWTNSSSFSAGHIYTNLRPHFDTFIGSDPSKAIFPTSLFSRSQIIADKRVAEVPLLTAGIRRFYENLIPLPRAEPRGERIGFFSQVEYLLKGTAVTLTALSVAGLYFGIKSLRRTRL